LNNNDLFVQVAQKIRIFCDPTIIPETGNALRIDLGFTGKRFEYIQSQRDWLKFHHIIVWTI